MELSISITFKANLLNFYENMIINQIYDKNINFVKTTYINFSLRMF